MNRDDQDMVNWYEKITQAAAAHHLLVNFHGAFKPTGMIRTYPNQITREGILGNEYNRWSSRVTLDFLGRGSWTLKLWKDAPDSGTVGEHLVTEQRAVTAVDVLTLHLARAGGAVASFEPVSRR